MTRTTPQRIVFWTGIFFLASGLFHVGVWLAAGTPSLVGPVTWRKPITFGFSTGILSLSIAWILGLLPQTPRLVTQARWFVGLLLAEIALIDMQQWRGVASHFNNSTPLDGAIFTAMGVLIVAASAIIAVWTHGLFRHPLPTTPAYALAARAGMILLNVGNLVGVIMAATQATSLKPLHGAALHTIQVLPIAVWLLARMRYARAWHGASPAARRSSSLRWHHQ